MNIDVKITCTFRLNNLISDSEVDELYNGDLDAATKDIIRSEGIMSLVDEDYQIEKIVKC